MVAAHGFGEITWDPVSDLQRRLDEIHIIVRRKPPLGCDYHSSYPEMLTSPPAKAHVGSGVWVPVERAWIGLPNGFALTPSDKGMHDRLYQVT